MRIFIVSIIALTQIMVSEVNKEHKYAIPCWCLWPSTTDLPKFDNLRNMMNVYTNSNGSDLIQCSKSFSKIEDDFIQLKCDYHREKLEIKDSVIDIHNDVNRNLVKVKNFNLENFHVENFEFQLNALYKVLHSFKKNFSDAIIESKISKEIFYENFGKLKKLKDSQLTKETKTSPNKINLNVLFSRQTDHAFVIMKLKNENKQCNGCNDLIPLQSLYLSHIEEFPSGSKSFIPHAYHIKQECLFRRGFEMKYLNNIPITSNLAVDKVFNNILTEIGFHLKNIFLTNSHINDSDSDNDIDNKNSDNDFPDNVSEVSNVSSVLTSLTSKDPCETFFYHRKPATQKKIITCKGCKANIETETYLSLKPRSKSLFHIEKKCIRIRGVPPDNFISVKCIVYKLLKTYNDLQELLACGFYYNNIMGYRPQNPNSQTDVSDHYIDNKNSENDFPDNVSEVSNVSSVLTSLTSKVPCDTFFYHRKPATQMKIITCHGCKANIETETYISLEANSASILFHIKKKCLRSGGVLPNNFICTKCLVYKLLKSHNDLQELLACGFYHNNIIGHRPQNPNSQKLSEQNDQKPNKPQTNNDPNQNNSSFLFNNEPFYYERLVYREKCRGCNNQILKNNMSLRHQERVPREKLLNFSLTSQYYHARKECLLERGFTSKYLLSIQCETILPEDGNLSLIIEALILCGFSIKKIIFIQKEINKPISLETFPDPTRPILENKLFIDYCLNPSAHCDGCGFVVMPNQPCFIYSSTREQNSNAKYFHIRKNCLTVHFTKDQIVTTICVINSSININLNEIFNCGVLKIVTESAGLCTRNVTNPSKKQLTANAFLPIPAINSSAAALFYVLTGTDPSLTCSVCHWSIPTDRYSLKLLNRPPNQVMIHLNPNCVSKLGMNSDEIANSNLVFFGEVPSYALTTLRTCGFRKLPCL